MLFAGSVQRLTDYVHLLGMGANRQVRAMKRLMAATRIDPAARQWLTALLGASVRFDEPMTRHTCFRIGGPADALAEPETMYQLKQLLEFAHSRPMPFHIIGGGTNLLVRDAGIRGLVIRLNQLAATTKWRLEGSQVRVTAGLGQQTRTLCALALRRGWEGMNFAIGIPGSLGGGIMMNAGTPSGSMADIIQRLTVLTAQGEMHHIDADAITWGYRRCKLPPQAGPGAILLEAKLSLTAGEKKTLRTDAQWIMKARVGKQPIGRPSAGSFFKNPTPGTAAGRLIEDAGLKGTRIGQAQISPIHANFIVNLGGATADEVLRLKALIETTIQNRYGIELEPEVCIVGETTGT